MAPLRPLLVVVAVVALVFGARPAVACRCLPPSVPKAARAADAVFVGTVERVDAGAATVQVRGVWKGVVAATVTVHDSPTSCRLGLAPGDALVFMVQNDRGRFTVRRCDGSQPTTAAVERALTKRLGAARAPLP